MTTGDVTGRGAPVIDPFRHSAVLVGRDLYECVTLCWWIGALLTCWPPWIVRASALVRCNVSRQLALASRYGGAVAPRAYRHDIVVHHGFLADAREIRRHASDRTARGDLWWHLYNPVVGGVVALLPFALLVEATWGLVLPFVWSRFHDRLDHPWVFGVPVAGQSTANVMAVVSAFLMVPILRWSGSWAVNVHCRWVGLILQAPRDSATDGPTAEPHGGTTAQARS